MTINSKVLSNLIKSFAQMPKNASKEMQQCINYTPQTDNKFPFNFTTQYLVLKRKEEWKKLNI